MVRSPGELLRCFFSVGAVGNGWRAVRGKAGKGRELALAAAKAPASYEWWCRGRRPAGDSVEGIDDSPALLGVSGDRDDATVSGDMDKSGG